MEPWERAEEVETIKATARREAREELSPDLLEAAASEIQDQNARDLIEEMRNGIGR